MKNVGGTKEISGRNHRAVQQAATGAEELSREALRAPDGSQRAQVSYK